MSQAHFPLSRIHAIAEELSRHGEKAKGLLLPGRYQALHQQGKEALRKMSRKKRKTRKQKIQGRIPPPPAKEKKIPAEPRRHPTPPPKPSGGAPPSLWKDFGNLFPSGSAPLRSDLPLYGCWVTKGWEEAGMANVCITRRMENGNLVFGAYLVDIWGLGLKDCFGHVEVPEKEFNSRVLPQLGRGGGLVKAEGALARRLVWGGYTWAQKHKFRVPREFKQWQGLVGELEEGETVEDIAFGRDGKPFLIMDMKDLGMLGK